MAIATVDEWRIDLVASSSQLPHYVRVRGRCAASRVEGVCRWTAFADVRSSA